MPTLLRDGHCTLECILQLAKYHGQVLITQPRCLREGLCLCLCMCLRCLREFILRVFTYLVSALFCDMFQPSVLRRRPKLSLMLALVLVLHGYGYDIVIAPATASASATASATFTVTRACTLSIFFHTNKQARPAPPTAAALSPAVAGPPGHHPPVACNCI